MFVMAEISVLIRGDHCIGDWVYEKLSWLIKRSTTINDHSYGRTL
jgi:hypothetical protein